MSRTTEATRGGVRSSALWGTGNRGGEHRSNALWGKGGRGLVTSLVLVLALALPLAASANGNGPGQGTYIAPGLLAQAQANPGQLVRVIIQSAGGVEGAKNALNGLGSPDREFGFIGAVAAEIPAAALKGLSRHPGLTITPDAPTKATDYTSTQLWPFQNGVSKLWGTTLNPAPQAPTIAIVDSGIDKSHPCFGDGHRVIDRQVVTRLAQDGSKLDGRGHGTFVAGLAACEAPGYAGAAPNATLVDLDAFDDLGRAFTSDVIAAAQWIYTNRASRNIRVANFSLHSLARGPFMKDPLNRAVERLWFGGVVVVAAAGNYGSATGPSGVRHAPGNDPFVLTVGALDLGGTVGVGNDLVPPWSAYGRTEAGFAKPEVVSAGRFMVGPIPMSSTLASLRAANIVAPGYIQLSGTSFAAPVVAGIAAQLLARYPGLTPDEVKGAIMRGVRPVPAAPPLAAGVGEVTATRSVNLVNRPNPNRALNQFLVVDSATGALTFDAVSWESAAKANVSWDSVSWDSISWADVSWDSVSWGDVSWESISWTDISWTDFVMDDISWEDAAEGEANSTGGYPLTPEEATAAAADPALALP